MKTILLAVSILVAALRPVVAATSDWTEVQGGAVRLLSAGPTDQGTYLLGLEFLLEPGWHTYWRYPGEAGIPPLIETDGSTNLGSIEVLYPAPERYDDGFSQSIVYHDGIVLPIRMTATDAGRSIGLSMTVAFGICKDICVPGDATFSLTLSNDASADTVAAKLIRRDLAAVPAAEGENAPKIVSVAAEGDALVITAEVLNPDHADLFAEGAAGSYNGLPKPTGRNGQLMTWHLSGKGLMPGPLRLVLIDGDRSVERLEPYSAPAAQ